MEVLSLKLPIGYRFSPTEVEIIDHFLRLKIEGRESEVELIGEVDIHKYEPWELPRLSVIKNNDPEWYFFCRLDKKNGTGNRFNRATKDGFWKSTGEDREIKFRSSDKKVIGMKKTLIFYKGRGSKTKKTKWIIHEYRMNSEQGAYVVCRLFDKDEKTDYSNQVEMELNVSSSLATGCSSMGIPYPESDLQVGEQVAGIGMPCDALENISSDALAPEASQHNNHMDSCVEDQGDKVTAREANPSTLKILDSYRFSPLPYVDTELGIFGMGSFSPDLGNDFDGMVSGSDTGTEVAQEQSPEVEVQCFDGTVDANDSLKTPPAVQGYWKTEVYQTEYVDENINGLDASRLDPATCTRHDLFNNYEESVREKNPVNDSDGVAGTGIKIRHRSKSHSSSQNFINQGNARRRIRFQRRLSCGAVSSEGEGSSYNAKDNEVAEGSVEHIAADEMQETTLQDSEIKREISHEEGQCPLAEVLPSRSSSFLSQYMAVGLDMFLFIGVWKTLEVLS